MFIFKKTNCIKFGGISLTLAFLLMATTFCTGVSPGADMVLHNAKITTLDSNNPSVTAVAIKDGRILKVGNNTEILKLKNESTQVLDLQGRRIIPGLNDSHSHYIRGGLAFNAILRWDGIPTHTEGLEMIRQQALRTPKDQWVRVIDGWAPHQFKENRLPTPEELTQAAPETPVYVQYFYSRAVVNKAGLKAIGFDENHSLHQDPAWNGGRMENLPDY